MRIATWNVNGIRARTVQLREWLEREKPDIVCLQELKATAEQIPDDCRLPDYHHYWHCLKGYSGVSLQLRKDTFLAEPAFTHPAFDFESRIVMTEVDGTIFASTYVPNGGKDYQAKVNYVKVLSGWAREVTAAGKQLVLCGDMNIAHTELDVHPKERKATAIGQLPEERSLFDDLLAAPLVDMGRKFDPDNPGLFSWWAPWRNLRQRNIGWRLDYVLASPGIAERATGCVVQADVGTSDHAPVMMTWNGTP